MGHKNMVSLNPEGQLTGEKPHGSRNQHSKCPRNVFFSSNLTDCYSSSSESEQMSLTHTVLRMRALSREGLGLFLEKRVAHSDVGICSQFFRGLQKSHLQYIATLRVNH